MVAYPMAQVLDVTGPVHVDKSFVVPSADGQPARLVVDVVPTTRKAFLEANRDYRDAQSAEALAKRNRALVPPSKRERKSVSPRASPAM